MNVIKSKWHCTLCADSKEGGREENQDYYACVDTNFGFLFVICDGMGGGPAGGNASMLAVQSIVMNVQNKPQGQNPNDVLYNAIVETNAFLRKNIKEHSQLMGMGTTCVVVLVTTNKAIIGHVGDSRLYHIRAGKKLFRTADHSFVGEMVRNGELSEEDARRASNSNVITRSLGMKESVEPEIDVIDIKPHDRIALCTDGVWGVMPETNLIQALSKERELAVLLPTIMNEVELIGKSKDNADYDNYTLGIIEINPVKSTTGNGKKTTNAGYLILGLILAFSLSLNVLQFVKIKENVYDDDKKLLSNENISIEESMSQTINGSNNLDNEHVNRSNNDLKDSVIMLLQNRDSLTKSHGEEK